MEKMKKNICCNLKKNHFSVNIEYTDYIEYTEYTYVAYTESSKLGGRKFVRHVVSIILPNSRTAEDASWN